MITMSSIPAATASSTTHWIDGRSTTVSISFGMALVAGRKRVPSPAAGITAVRTLVDIRGFSSRIAGGAASQRSYRCFVPSQKSSNVRLMTNNQDCSDPSSDGDLPPGPTGNRTHDREGDRDRQRTKRGDAPHFTTAKKSSPHAMPMSGEIRSPPPPAVATPFPPRADGSRATHGQLPLRPRPHAPRDDRRRAAQRRRAPPPSARRSRRRAHPLVSPQCDTCSRHRIARALGRRIVGAHKASDELRGREGADDVAGDDAKSQKHGLIVRCRPAGVPVSSETCRPTTTDATIVARRLRSGSRSPRTP